MRSLRRLLYKGMKYILFFLLSLCLLLFVGLLMSGYEKDRVCAELPNGLLIGYVSFIKPLKNVFYLHITLKLPDGNALIESDYYANSFYFSKSTVYGVIVPRYGPQGYRHGFAFRPDVGFVLNAKDSDLYEKLEEEAGQLFIIHRGDKPFSQWGDIPFKPQQPGQNMVHTDIAGTYLRLIEDPLYRRENCPLDIFPQDFFPQ